MNCLRCGREIEEGTSFCRECLKEVGKPLEESPYLSTRVTLPVRSSRRQSAPQSVPPKKAQKSERKKSRKGLIAAVVILGVFCLLLAGTCCWLLRDRFLTDDATANQIRMLEEENLHLSNDLEGAQKELADRTGEAEALRAENEELRNQISGLEESLNGDRKEHSEMDLSMRDLEGENLKLEGEKGDLTEQKKKLESQNKELEKKKKELEGQKKELTEQIDQRDGRISELEASVEALREENKQLSEDLAGLRTENKEMDSTLRFIDDHIAFINSGSRYYHRLSCSSFKRGQSWFALNIAAAREQGYLPCPNCG